MEVESMVIMIVFQCVYHNPQSLEGIIQRTLRYRQHEEKKKQTKRWLSVKGTLSRSDMRRVSTDSLGRRVDK